MASLRVLLLEPHDGGSHRAVARGLARHSRHAITIDSLPARNWKWRLRAAGLVFAGRHARDLSEYDLVLASSLMNVADLRARAAGAPPVILYMHESQIAYPEANPLGATRTGFDTRRGKGAGAARRSRRGPVTEAAGGPPREWGLLFADLSSAAAADLILFNSRHHRKTFLAGVRRLLRYLPDAAPAGLLAALRRRSRVLYPGVELQDVPVPASAVWQRARQGWEGAPLILWNHRWEFDKRPEIFFAALRDVAQRGGSFRLALLGESARVVPKSFLEARERFGGRIVGYGRAPTRAAYVRWLARADGVVSTSAHENFGIAWLEAMAAGAFPLLPDRLAYPELLPAALRSRHLYRDREDLCARLLRLCREPETTAEGRDLRSRAARRFRWEARIGEFDRIFEETVLTSGAALREPR